MTYYATLQSILQESGFWHRVVDQELLGVTDWANRSFRLQNYPIVSANDSDQPTSLDLTVYVNGIAVPPSEVEIISAERGEILLENAPGSGTSVTVNYYYSTIPMYSLNQIRDEVQSIIDAKMRYAGDLVPYQSPTGQIKLITKLYCSALLLIREYGNHQDSEGTSRDGYKKLSLAKEMLEDLASKGDSVMSNSISVSESAMDVSSKDIFGEYKP